MYTNRFVCHYNGREEFFAHISWEKMRNMRYLKKSEIILFRIVRLIHFFENFKLKCENWNAKYTKIIMIFIEMRIYDFYREFECMEKCQILEKFGIIAVRPLSDNIFRMLKEIFGTVDFG